MGVIVFYASVVFLVGFSFGVEVGFLMSHDRVWLCVLDLVNLAALLGVLLKVTHVTAKL